MRCARFYRLTLIGLMIACSSWSSAQSGRRHEVGVIETVTGQVRVESDVRQSPNPQVGETLYEGELLQTGNDGEVHLHLMDGGYLALRPNAMLRFTRYQAYGDAEDRGTLTLVKGSMRLITGWIAAEQSRQWQIKTPTATVTTRAADHETWVIPEFDPGGDGGTYVQVYHGKTTLAQRREIIEMSAGQTGMAGIKDRPRLLERAPGFYQPGRYDDLFTGKFDRLQENLAEIRRNRITALRAVFRDRQLPVADQKTPARERGYVPPVGAVVPAATTPIQPRSTARAECRQQTIKTRAGKKTVRTTCQPQATSRLAGAAKKATTIAPKSIRNATHTAGRGAAKSSSAAAVAGRRANQTKAMKSNTQGPSKKPVPKSAQKSTQKQSHHADKVKR
ncbi:FecR domain-containing protein [Parvibium lacunae]|uniref:FecR protein domain-containing protein n=1 Tax=Parvibium lacunae TaxID=1888893 RepID=A0A368L815_9BURK|nr:FecR domain-containing protein [Parvibium lacunae]RCS59379.1 hypothetical protein DU000_01180 [Parvibium lacunae]